MPVYILNLRQLKIYQLLLQFYFLYEILNFQYGIAFAGLFMVFTTNDSKNSKLISDLIIH